MKRKEGPRHRYSDWYVAGKGIFVIVVDFSKENGREVASLVQKENKMFYGDPGVPSAIFIKCDITNAGKSFFLSGAGKDN